MNAHQRRVSERAKNLDGFKAHRATLREQAPTFWPAVKTRQSGATTFSHPVTVREPRAVWTPTGLAIGAPAEAIRDSVLDEAENLRTDYVFIEGGSVRNRRTKSVATALARRPVGMILVHRRDNRKVEWPVSECENWNL